MVICLLLILSNTQHNKSPLLATASASNTCSPSHRNALFCSWTLTLTKQRLFYSQIIYIIVGDILYNNTMHFIIFIQFCLNITTFIIWWCKFVVNIFHLVSCCSQVIAWCWTISCAFWWKHLAPKSHISSFFYMRNDRDGSHAL